MSTLIDRLYDENTAILDFIKSKDEPSLHSDADNKLKKILIMSAASYFETRIQETIRNFVAQASQDNSKIKALMEAKVISRQYHEYFDWTAQNANKFLKLFGDDFLMRFQSKVKKDQKLEEAIRSFIQIGVFRNELAHKNFAVHPIGKTGQEVYELYKRALKFVEKFEEALLEAA